MCWPSEFPSVLTAPTPRTPWGGTDEVASRTLPTCPGLTLGRSSPCLRGLSGRLSAKEVVS